MSHGTFRKFIMLSRLSLLLLLCCVNIAPFFAAHAQNIVVEDAEWRPFNTEASSSNPGPPNQGPDRRSNRGDVGAPPLTNDARGDAKSVADLQDEVSASASIIRVGSILVDTKADIDHALFEKAIEGYLGKEVARGDLARLAQEIAAIARSHGMVLADAHIPPQEIELGIIKVVLEAGTIDEVRINGSSNRALRKLLDPLVGKVAMQEELERRLTLANNIPQISVKRSEIIQEGNRRILSVDVANKDRFSARLSADNYGSNNVGPVRARLSVEAVALLDDSDYLNVTFRTNPLDPAELLSAGASYGLGLNGNGTRAELSVAWSRSNIDPSFGFDERDSRSYYASFSVNHPLQRSRKANLWLNGQFEYLQIEQDSLGALLQSDTVVTLSTGISASLKTGKGWFRAGTQIRQGLGILGANRPGDPFSSRFDADGTFTAAQLWANWSGKPAGDLTFRVAVSGQVASEPLLSSEEIGLGGAFLGKAFDPFERSGDQGVTGLTEIGYEFLPRTGWFKRLQPYAFVDGGYVDNLRDGFGSGTLISAGGGIRADIGNFDLQLETAVPIYQSGDSFRNSSTKVNLQIGLDL